MTHLNLFIAAGIVGLSVLAALRHQFQGRPRPRTKAHKRLLRSWLTPEQDKQWAARRDFEVIGCDTGIRYRLIYRAAMNVYELDPAGHPVAQWCFVPEGDLAIADVLLAQKIALETMERRALARARRQTLPQTSS
jgi:hypothetical protein